MTFIIAAHLQSKIFLAADTRTTIKKTREHIDTSKKIIKTNYGLITGYGDYGLNNYLKDELSKIVSLHNIDLHKYYKEKREFLLKEQNISILDDTGLIVSYVKDSPINKYLSLVCIDEKSIDYIEDKTVQYMGTQGWNKKEDESYIIKYIENININLKDISENQDLKTSLYDFHKNIYPIFNHFGSKYDSMSQYVQYGIHTKDNKIYITKIVKSISQHPAIIH